MAIFWRAGRGSGDDRVLAGRVHRYRFVVRRPYLDLLARCPIVQAGLRADEAYGGAVTLIQRLVGSFINTAAYMLDKFGHVWHRDAILRPGVAHAEEEPVPY